MALSGLKHYHDAYCKVRKNYSYKEANKRALIVVAGIIGEIITRVNILISGKKEHVNNEGGKILFIESTNKGNGWGIGDGIFRTSMIADLANSGIIVDVITHIARKDIFKNNPDINNLQAVNGSLSNLLKTAFNLKNNGYTGILILYPDIKKQLLGTIIGTKINKYIEPKNMEYMMASNHIEIYREAVAKYFPNISKGDGKTKIVLTEEEKEQAKIQLNKDSEKMYIGINIGGKSSLRNYKNWNNIITELNKDFGENIIFVLYGKKNTLGIDTEIENNHSNIINYVGRTNNLRQLYGIINEMDINIGMDGGNINASIALGRPTLPIYNVVRGVNRIPQGFDESMIIQGECEKGYCGERARGADTCIITGQISEEHNITPPCLQSEEFTKKITHKCNEIIKKLLIEKSQKTNSESLQLS